MRLYFARVCVDPLPDFLLQQPLTRFPPAAVLAVAGVEHDGEDGEDEEAAAKGGQRTHTKRNAKICSTVQEESVTAGPHIPTGSVMLPPMQLVIQELTSCVGIILRLSFTLLCSEPTLHGMCCLGITETSDYTFK